MIPSLLDTSSNDDNPGMSRRMVSIETRKFFDHMRMKKHGKKKAHKVWNKPVREQRSNMSSSMTGWAVMDYYNGLGVPKNGRVAPKALPSC